MRALAAVLVIVLVTSRLAAEDEAPKPLSWQHEGFAAIALAANTAKAQGKRLLVGLSGGST